MKYILMFVLTVSGLNASELVKDGKTFQVNDKEYIIRCIDGYRWIQFLERFSQRTIFVRGSITYVPSGDPHQMFERESGKTGATSVPAKCENKGIK